MLISSMNENFPNTLVIIIKPDVVKQSEIINKDVVRIFDSKTDETLGFNFLNVDKVDDSIVGNGFINLSENQIKKLNNKLSKSGFNSELSLDKNPKFVIGYVKTIKDHPNSDHLKIAYVDVGEKDLLQIVSGSPNIKSNINVVVAKNGAVMPDGKIIWSGKLRGVDSNGMIASGYELHLKNAPTKRGALILPNDFGTIGSEFDFNKGNQLFNN